MKTREEYLMEALDTTGWEDIQKNAIPDPKTQGEITIGAQAVLKSLKDLGYKSPYKAINELIDNGMEAGAKEISIVVNTDGKTQKPLALAIIDNGHGMIKEMVQYALSLGGSARGDKKKGFGKYGFGLVTASLGMGNKFSLYSKIEKGDFYRSFVDLELIASGDDLMYPFKKKGIHTPAPTRPEKVDPPQWVLEAFKKLKGKGKSGSIVLIEKLDGRFPKRKDTIENHIKEEVGLTYANFLDKVTVIVGDEIVEPLDPLWLRPGFKFHTLPNDGKLPDDANGNEQDTPWDDKATELPETSFTVPVEGNPNTKGEVRIRYSWIPISFARLPEAKGQTKPGKKNSTYNKRYSIIREKTHGIIILRKGRLIDVLKNPGTGLSIKNWMNLDRYINIEIDFDPVLDADFNVTTSKQQIVLSDRMWNILESKGLSDAISTLRKQTANNTAEISKFEKKDLKQSDPSFSPAAKVMSKQAKGVERSREESEEGAKNVKKAAMQAAQSTGLDPKELAQKLMEHSQEFAYEIKWESNGEENAFFRPVSYGGARHLCINMDHPFYEHLYDSDSLPIQVRWMLEVLLFSFGEAELPTARDSSRRRHIQEARTTWSSKLAKALIELPSMEKDPFIVELEEGVAEDEEFPVETDD